MNINGCPFQLGIAVLAAARYRTVSLKPPSFRMRCQHSKETMVTELRLKPGHDPRTYGDSYARLIAEI
jgi:hypothetical protein